MMWTDVVMQWLIITTYGLIFISVYSTNREPKEKKAAQDPR